MLFQTFLCNVVRSILNGNNFTSIRSTEVKIRTICLYAVPLLLVAGIAYGNFNGGSEPGYVKDAMSAVSNKMSYTYGVTRCKASQGTPGQWSMSCSSANTPIALSFTVLPSDKALSDVATPFYLIASNEVAKKSSGEGLLSFLMINTDGTAGEAKQIAAN